MCVCERERERERVILKSTSRIKDQIVHNKMTAFNTFLHCVGGGVRGAERDK